jgi:hypothetical protein
MDMASHHIMMFVVDGKIVYIHYQPANPSAPEPGNDVHAPHGNKIKWSAPNDGGFSIEFKTESPFESGAGAPGNPIISPDGHPTKLETLKTIATVKRTFKYTAKLAGITDDPQIVIDDSGGSGGGGGQAKKTKKAKKKK